MDEQVKRMRDAATRGFQIHVDEVGLEHFGTDYQLVGAIFAGDQRAFVTLFAGESLYEAGPIYPLEFLKVEDWEAFLRQLDTQEVEILRNVEGVWTKAILRKSQRQIEQNVQWAVFRRDSYECRYCGRRDVPLTVDHLVLWEDNGPRIEDNLVASCRKCNRTRGRTPYVQWLQHPYYLKVSQNLTVMQRYRNSELVEKLDQIPRVENKRSR